MQRRIYAAWVFGLALATNVAAQQVNAASAPAAVRVTLDPERPVQGTIFRVEVEAAGETVILQARYAGEPLHFEEVVPGMWTALAAVPIGATGQTELPVVLRRPGGADTVRLPVVIRDGTYRTEKLRVAPEFGRAPDAALRERMRQESAKARAVSARAHRTPRLWEAPFRLPRDTRITSRFGDGREFNGQITSRHMGTDLAGGVGAPVRAAANGIVALVDRFYLGGNVVYLDHGGGLVTAYLHLSATLVTEGQAVSAGEVIGRVGATGRVTGPHLHWIARYGGITVNPFSLPGLSAGPGELTARP